MTERGIGSDRRQAGAQAVVGADDGRERTDHRQRPAMIGLWIGGLELHRIHVAIVEAQRGQAHAQRVHRGQLARGCGA